MFKVFLVSVILLSSILCSSCVNQDIIKSWEREHNTISKEYYEKILCKDGRFADGTQLTADDIAARKFNYEQSEKTLRELLK